MERDRQTGRELSKMSATPGGQVCEMEWRNDADAITEATTTTTTNRTDTTTTTNTDKSDSSSSNSRNGFHRWSLSDWNHDTLGLVYSFLDGESLMSVYYAVHPSNDQSTKSNLAQSITTTVDRALHYAITVRLQQLVKDGSNATTNNDNETGGQQQQQDRVRLPPTMRRVLQDVVKKLENEQDRIALVYWIPVLDYFEYATEHRVEEFPIWVGRLRFLRRDSFQLIESNVVITCLANEWNPGMIPRVDGIPPPPSQNANSEQQQQQQRQRRQGNDNLDHNNAQQAPPPQRRQQVQEDGNDDDDDDDDDGEGNHRQHLARQQQRARSMFLQQGRVYVMKHWDKIVLWDPRREGMNYVFPYLDHLRFSSIQMRGAGGGGGGGGGPERHCLQCHWKSNPVGTYQQWDGTDSVEMLISQIYSTMRNLRTLQRNMGTHVFYECGLWQPPQPPSN